MYIYIYILFCPGSYDSLFKALPVWHYKTAIVYKWLISTSKKALLSCAHAVHVSSGNSAWHEAPTLALHITRCVCGYGDFSVSGWDSLSLSLACSLSGRCKWCKFLSCSTPVLFWCDGNPFARPKTPSHRHYSFIQPALFSFLGETSWDTKCAS